jgi:hypothetical protein
MRTRTFIGLVFVSAIAASSTACSDDEDHRTDAVLPLDEEPLALLAQGDGVLLAASAELARVSDADPRTAVRLTDGVYRTCPWDPWVDWEEPLGIAPSVTSDGRFVTITAHGCGAWAWPLTGGTPVPLARAEKGWGKAKPDDAPMWDPTSDVPVVADGDGWIACGRQTTNTGMTWNSEIWSLAADGAHRKKLGEMNGDCLWLAAEPDALYASNGSSVGRFDRASGTWTSLATRGTFRDLRVVGTTPTHVVFLDQHRVERVPKTGGPTEVVVEKPIDCSFFCFAAAVDATHVYWTDGKKLARTPHADLARPEIVSAETPRRRFVVTDLPTLAVTDQAVWTVTSEGETFQSRRPFLSRVVKPL